MSLDCYDYVYHLHSTYFLCCFVSYLNTIVIMVIYIIIIGCLFEELLGHYFFRNSSDAKIKSKKYIHIIMIL